jgi:hypothetical protein
MLLVEQVIPTQMSTVSEITYVHWRIVNSASSVSQMEANSCFMTIVSQMYQKCSYITNDLVIKIWKINALQMLIS